MSLKPIIMRSSMETWYTDSLVLDVLPVCQIYTGREY